jgi:hypothetical protein
MGMISFEDVKNVAGLVEFVGGVAMVVVALWAKANFMPRSELKAAINKIESEFDKIEDKASKEKAATLVRLSAVEALAAQCATREQLASLQADYRELRAQVEAVDERLDDSLPQIRTALTRIEDYLLKVKP